MRVARGNHAGVFLAAWLAAVVILTTAAVLDAFPDGMPGSPAMDRYLTGFYSAIQQLTVSAQMHVAILAPVLVALTGILILGFGYRRLVRWRSGSKEV